MKNFIKAFLVSLLFVINSCSLLNKSTVTVPINSNPPGAIVTIDGVNMGVTPALVELKPNKNYQAKVSKRGFGSTTIDMETWWSVRDGKGADGARCMADTVLMGLPYMIMLLIAQEKCGSFKKESYTANLVGDGSGIGFDSQYDPNSAYGQNPYQNNMQNQNPAGYPYQTNQTGYQYQNSDPYQNNPYNNSGSQRPVPNPSGGYHGSYY